MYSGRRVLSVIPARGGSKGIPKKNLAKLGGIPLVTRAAQVSTSVSAVDCTVVSTDDDLIAEAAVAGGAEAPFRRPVDLSGDQVADHPVLLHALAELHERPGQTEKDQRQADIQHVHHRTPPCGSCPPDRARYAFGSCRANQELVKIHG